MPNEWKSVTSIKRAFKEFYALEEKAVSINELDAVRKEAKLDILESLFNYLFDDDITEE